VAWGDDDKLHRGFAFGHQRSENLKRDAFSAGLQFKKTKVAKTNEAEGEVQQEFLRGCSVF
jgi:hypothetical protein